MPRLKASSSKEVLEWVAFIEGSGKRGQVQSTDYLPGDLCVIHAKVPLSEMGTYSNTLKSMTGGQGSFVMDYSHDERTPPNVQAEIVAAFKPRGEDD